MEYIMKNKTLASIAAMGVLAGSFGWVLAEEPEKTAKPKVAREPIRDHIFRFLSEISMSKN